jgi:Flp pilus assembly pilin Flp
MFELPSLRTWLRRVHRDQRGAVSLETILIVAAIALPILIFLLKYGWPKIKTYFETGLQNLENESNNVINSGSSSTGR